MGIARTGYQAIANAIWTLVAVGSRTVTVNDKTGFSLTTDQHAVRRVFHQNITASSLGSGNNADTALGTSLSDYTKGLVVVTNPSSTGRVYLTSNSNVRLTNTGGSTADFNLSIYVVEFMNVLS